MSSVDWLNVGETAGLIALGVAGYLSKRRIDSSTADVKARAESAQDAAHSAHIQAATTTGRVEGVLSAAELQERLFQALQDALEREQQWPGRLAELEARYNKDLEKAALDHQECMNKHATLERRYALLYAFLVEHHPEILKQKGLEP